MTKKKLDFLVIGPLIPYRGGISDTNHSLIKSLQSLGLNVKSWTFKKLYPDFIFPGKSQFIKTPINSELIGERILNTLNPFEWSRNRRKLISLNPRYVIFRYWTPFLSPIYSSLAKNIPESIKKIALVDNWIQHEKRFFDSIFNKYFGNKMDFFITFSKNVSIQIKESGFVNVFNGFHPINNNLPEKITKKLAREKLNLSHKKKYVLFFGIIRKYKGLDLLIQSFSEDCIKDENIELIIVGEFYDNNKKYYNQINKLNLNSKILFDSEFVSNEKLRDYFCAADIVAQTYRSASQSGVTPMAYKYMTPMVVTNIDGLKDPIEIDKTGCVSDLNSRQIAKNIRLCLESSNYKMYINQFKKKSIKYNWDDFSLDLIKYVKL